MGELPVTAVVVSPDSEGKALVIAAVSGGFLLSSDNGESWGSVTLPAPVPSITCLGISPQFATDGTIFAGTLEDGVLCSYNRGTDWVAWNFGLTDLSVLGIALSPDFGTDGTLVIATETGVFLSSNGGRGWRETQVIAGLDTVLSVAFSHNYASDGVIFAGTASSGLFATNNRGRDWARLDGNILNGEISVICLGSFGLLVLHNNEILLSTDSGRSFKSLDIHNLKGVQATAIFISSTRRVVLVGCGGSNTDVATIVKVANLESA